MGFPDENIQITSDLWITYEEEYIIVIQPEVDREGSLTTIATYRAARAGRGTSPSSSLWPACTRESWIVLCCRRAAVFAQAYEY